MADHIDAYVAITRLQASYADVVRCYRSLARRSGIDPARVFT
jgi:hypothetical protein